MHLDCFSLFAMKLQWTTSWLNVRPHSWLFFQGKFWEIELLGHAFWLSIWPSHEQALRMISSHIFAHTRYYNLKNLMCLMSKSISSYFYFANLFLWASGNGCRYKMGLRKTKRWGRLGGISDSPSRSPYRGEILKVQCTNCLSCQPLQGLARLKTALPESAPISGSNLNGWSTGSVKSCPSHSAQDISERSSHSQNSPRV